MGSLAARASLACLAIGMLAICACAPSYNAFEIDRRLSKTLGAAQFHVGLRELAEAGQLALAIERIDPQYPGLTEVKAKLDAGVEDLFATRPIGSNRARRYKIERPLAARIVRYLPDRVLDLLDIVSADVHSGLGAFVDVHATRAVQASAGARVAGGVGLLPHRAIPGFELLADAGVQVFGIGNQSFVGFVSGPSGIFTGSASLSGVNAPSDRFYQDFRDYWAIGFSGTVGLAGGGAELHPVQAVDFLLGFAGVDLCNDDTARTRGLRLLTSERDLLQELARIESSPELMLEYQSNREELHAPVQRGSSP
jgi:hypothetical protein